MHEIMSSDPLDHISVVLPQGGRAADMGLAAPRRSVLIPAS